MRTNALTLKAFLEARIGATIEGHRHIYSWLMRHSSFLYNRFGVCARGAPPFEILYGRRFKAKLVPFGEVVLFHRASKHRGELQWLRGVWLGLNERNNANVLGTPEGVCESRSIRRLPREQQWCAATVLGMQGFVWDYMGKAKRRRALYPGGAGASRIPLLPDSASLEEIAKAAGRAAAAEIPANTPVPPGPGDEAASDPTTSSSSSSTSGSGSPMAVNDQGHNAVQQEQTQQNRQQEPREHPHPHPPGQSVPSVVQQEQSQQNRPQEPREHPHPHPPGQSPMAGVVEQGGPDSSQQGGVPKRPRLLLDRPRDQGGADRLSPSPSASLYPPGFAGVHRVHGDVPPQEHVGYDGWSDELLEAMAEESQEAESWEPQWDADGEHAPDLPPDELAIVDQKADHDELARLLEMGVARRPREGEDISGYGRLTTKVVRD